MAASALVIYYILNSAIGGGGNDLNGGGFDSSVTSPGTDYSQVTGGGAHVAFNGTTITATTTAASATIVITGYTVATTDNGNSVNIASGTLFIAGVYTIISVNVGLGTWTLDRNCTSGIGSAMVGRMGGGWASPKSANFTSASNWLVPGCAIMVQGNGTNNPTTVDYATTGFITPPNGNNSAGRIRMIGYNGRPHISSDGLMHVSNAIWTYSGLKFSMTGSSNNSGHGVIGDGGDVIFNDIIFDQKNTDTKLGISVSGSQFHNVAAYSSVAISGGAGTQAVFDLTGSFSGLASGCTAYGVKGIGFKMDIGAVAEFCIAANCASTGFQLVNTRADMPIKITNCTVDANLGHGIEMTTDNAVQTTQIKNCIVSNHTVSGKFGVYANNSRTAAVNDVIKSLIDYNDLWSNNGAVGGGYQGLTAGAHDLNVDPGYTNAGSGDYSIGTNLKAMGFPGALPSGGGIATTGYLDIGAAQRQEAGGTGGMIMSRLQAGM